MDRRQFLQNIGASAFGLGLLSSFSIKDLKSAYEIREVQKGTYIYTNRGGTIMFKLTEAGWIVVDTQFPEQSNELIAELGQRDILPIKLLVNTHHHGDHSGGNIAFKGLVRDIVAHENSVANQKATAVSRKNEDAQLYPNITFEEGWYNDIGGERVMLRYFGAGHTNGDAWVHFENSNVVHAGDMMFNRRHPFIDKSAGAMVSSWIDVLERVSNTYEDDTKFVFGHAAQGYDVIGTKTDILDFRTYLSQAYNFVDNKLRIGASPEEVKSLKAFDFESTWSGDGIERVLGALVDELSEDEK